MVDLDFLYIDGDKVAIKSKGIGDDISEYILENCRFSERPENVKKNNAEIKIIPIKEGSIAFSYNFWPSLDSKHGPSQVSHVLILSMEEFLKIGKSIEVIKEMIQKDLKDFMINELSSKNFEDLRKKLRKNVKKLPVSLERLSIDVSPYLPSFNERFLRIREKFKDLKDDLKKVFISILYSSQVIMTHQEQEGSPSLIDDLISLTYFIMPVNISMFLSYSGHEPEFKDAAIDIDLMNLKSIDSLLTNEQIQEDFKNGKKILIEIGSKGIMVKNIEKIRDKNEVFVEYLVNKIFAISDIEELINIEVHHQSFLSDNVYQEDFLHFKDFLMMNKKKLKNLTKWISEKKTEIMLFLGNFNVFKPKFQYLLKNREILKGLHEISERYSELEEELSFSAIFQGLLADFSVEREEKAFALNLLEIMEKLKVIRETPFKSLKRRVFSMLDNQRLPEWLTNLQDLGILSQIKEVKEAILKENKRVSITESIRSSTRLDVEVYNIIGESFFELIKSYDNNIERHFYDHFMELLLDVDNFFILTLITHKKILNYLRQISLELFLKLEKARRSNDNIDLLTTAVWFSIMHGRTTPEITWNTMIEDQINEIRYILNRSEFKEELLIYEWTVPDDFKNIIVSIVEDDYIDKFLEFRSEYIEAYGTIYDNLKQLKEQHSKDTINEIITYIFEKGIDIKDLRQIKLLNVVKKVESWRVDSRVPNNIYKMIIDIINEEGLELLLAFNECMQQIDSLIMKFPEVLTSEKILNDIDGYIQGKTELNKELDYFQVLNDLSNFGGLEFLINVFKEGKQDIIKEVKYYIREAEFSTANKLGTEFFEIFAQFQKNKEEIYSRSFKGEQISEAFINYLETGDSFEGFFNFSGFSREIMEIANNKS